jgi:hypothetical protein
LSQVAFAHALKIALLAKAELEIVHVQGHLAGDMPSCCKLRRAGQPLRCFVRQTTACTSRCNSEGNWPWSSNPRALFLGPGSRP